jgi:hypothetical protein
MANVKWSSFPVDSPATGSDLLVGLRAGVNVQFDPFPSTLVGAYTTSFTFTGNTAVTFPTSGTLATTSQATTYTVVTATTLALMPNTNYLIASPTLCSMTLPVTSAEGDAIVIAGSSGGWTILQNAGQNITWGDQTTLTGTGGSLSSLTITDGCTLVCDAANTTWVVTQPQGNMTLVIS